MVDKVREGSDPQLPDSRPVSVRSFYVLKALWGHQATNVENEHFT